MTIDADMYSWYMPTGPYVVNPPPPDPPGGPTGDPKKLLKNLAKDAKVAGVVIGVVSLIPGVGETEIAGGITIAIVGKYTSSISGALGVLSDAAGNDPPQSNYAIAATASRLHPPANPRAAEWATPFVDTDQEIRLFIDAIERAQGAFLAGDVNWVQRHTLTANQAYHSFGEHLIRVAERTEQMTSALRNSIPRPLPMPQPAALQQIVTDGAREAGMPEAEKDSIETEYLEILREKPSVDALQFLSRTARQVGQRIASPRPTRFRFAFGPRPS